MLRTLHFVFSLSQRVYLTRQRCTADIPHSSPPPLGNLWLDRVTATDRDDVEWTRFGWPKEKSDLRR